MKNKNNPKVSILIASFNNARYLRKCINSALNQNYVNKEVIVIDDGSTDQSIKIIKSYKKRIKVAFKKKKKFFVGSYDQLQSYIQCFQISKGDFIFLDGDDYFDNNKVSLIIKKFLKKKEIKIIYDLPILFNIKKRKKIRLKNSIIKNYWSNIMPTSCISVRRKELSKIFKIISFKLFPDVWLDFRINIYAKYLIKNNFYLKKNLTFYRQTNTNVSYQFKHLSKKLVEKKRPSS